MSLRQVAKQVTPPVIWRGLQRLRAAAKPRFTGDYETWAAAMADASADYEGPKFLQNVRDSVAMVRDGKAAYDRDSVAFMEEDFRWPCLACLLAIAAQNNGRLSVVDFGGGLGSVYFQHRKFFRALSDLNWSVVERPPYVEIGRREFQTDTLRFFTSLDEAVSYRPADVIVFAGPLQYLENPFEALSQAAATCGRILVDRMPLIDSERDRITLQHFAVSDVSGSQPHRFFSDSKFASFMADLELTRFVEWPALDVVEGSRYIGALYTSETASL